MRYIVKRCIQKLNKVLVLYLPYRFSPSKMDQKGKRHIVTKLAWADILEHICHYHFKSIVYFILDFSRSNEINSKLTK